MVDRWRPRGGWARECGGGRAGVDERVAGRRLLEAAAYADAEAAYEAALEAVGMHGFGGVPARDSE